MIYELITNGRFWFFFLFFLCLYFSVWIAEDTEHLPRQKPLRKRENPPGSGITPFWLFWRVNIDWTTEQVIEDQFVEKVWRQEPERFSSTKIFKEQTDYQDIENTNGNSFGDHEHTIEDKIKETFKMDYVDGAWIVEGSWIDEETGDRVTKTIEI